MSSGENLSEERTFTLSLLAVAKLEVAARELYNGNQDALVSQAIGLLEGLVTQAKTGVGTSIVYRNGPIHATITFRPADEK